jgi:hypothetical protein
VLTFKKYSICRTNGLSDRRTIALSDYRTIGRTPANLKGPEHWKHDIIDGQTIGRATQELKKNHIYEQRGLNKDLDPIVMNR